MVDRWGSSFAARLGLASLSAPGKAPDSAVSPKGATGQFVERFEAEIMGIILAPPGAEKGDGFRRAMDYNAKHSIG